MKIEITDRVDLERAETLVSWLRRPHVDWVTITLPGLDIAEREQSAEAIRHLFNDCGCTWATLALLAAGTAAFLSGPSGGQAVAAAALGCLAAAVVGKLVGLAWSRQRLLARLRVLRSAVARLVEEGISHGTRLH